MYRDDTDQPYVSFPDRSRRPALPDRAAWLDRERLVDQRPRRRPWLDVLLRLEGGARDADALAGGRLWAAGRPRELRLPGLGTDADGRCGYGRGGQVARHRH